MLLFCEFRLSDLTFFYNFESSATAAVINIHVYCSHSNLQYLRYLSLAVSFAAKLLYFVSSPLYLLLLFLILLLLHRSSNVPFPVHDFKRVFHFTLNTIMGILSFTHFGYLISRA
jgi:hypothetical protein